MFVFGCILFKISKIKGKEIAFALVFMVILICLNMVGIYVFSPEHGVSVYGTRHELFHIFWRYSITLEQLFYMLNFTLKYLAVIPVALLFIMATNPSEFAASLNKIGVSYKIGYAVSIALRYIPDVQRDFKEISQSQQARGIDLSKKDKIMTRLKNAISILFPLVMSSLNRIETISNAMELRGFGKYKKRTWIVERPFKVKDAISIGIGICILGASILLIVLNGSRYFNIFI